MPDVYISRAGMQSKELDEKFSSTEMEELQKKLEIQEQARLIEVERLENNEELKERIKAEIWEEVIKKYKRE